VTAGRKRDAVPRVLWGEPQVVIALAVARASAACWPRSLREADRSPADDRWHSSALLDFPGQHARRRHGEAARGRSPRHACPPREAGAGIMSPDVV